MASGKWEADEVAGARNLCAGVVAVIVAFNGVAQATGAPGQVKIGLAVAAALGAVGVLVLHLLERRATGGEATNPPAAEHPVPRSLPSGPMKFVNRDKELTRLDELMERAESSPGPLVAVLGGLPGVGKSAVGMRWASGVRTRFADGDLFADFSERRRGTAIDVSGVLGDFIRKLGPAEIVVPPKLRERADLFHTMTFGRRLLILLDDVTEAAQVKQLRPAGGGSVVIATTYKQLDELHYEGAEFVPVNPLPEDRARRLLVEMAGEAGWRFEEAPKETGRVLEFCGGLSLPLCVCAARLLTSQGALTASSIADEIADEEQRLNLLSGKGEYAGAAVFGFAYADLEPGRQLVYRRLGLHPGLDLDASHAALLARISTTEAKKHLAALVDTHLLESADDGRFRFHGLVRLHARECAEREDPDALCESLQRHLVDWYYTCIRDADRTIVPERLRLAQDETIPVDQVPEFDSREAAFGWLEAERPNILAVLQMARDREWDQRVWQMAEALWPFHHNRRHYADWIDATTIGIECARRAKHGEVEGRLRAQLSVAFIDLGDFDRAREELERAERTVGTSKNMRLRGSIREFTGVCSLNEGDYDRALEAFRQARQMFESIEGARGVAIQDYFIGRVLTRMDKYGEALRALESALATMRAIDDRLFIGRIQLRLGQAIRQDGRPDEAESVLREGIAVLAPLGMRLEEAESYEELAAVASSRDDAEAAAEHLERAQSIYRAIGHPKAGEFAVAGAGSMSVAATD